MGAGLMQEQSEQQIYNCVGIKGTRTHEEEKFHLLLKSVWALKHPRQAPVIPGSGDLRATKSQEKKKEPDTSVCLKKLPQRCFLRFIT